MMKTITALRLQKKNKDRVNLFLDGEYALAVPFETAAGLRKGQQLSEEEIDRLREDGEENRAYHQALRFLGYRPRSEAEVTRRLTKHGHDEALVQSVLERLAREGYVDDAEFARFWVDNRTRFRPRSARALSHELRQKGLSSSVIEVAITDVDEERAAWDALAGKTSRWQALDEQQFLRKVAEFLSRRGFSYEICRSTAERAWQEEHDDD